MPKVPTRVSSPDRRKSQHGSKVPAWVRGVTEPPNYDGPHVHVIVIMTSDSRTYVPHNLKDLLSSEKNPITGVLQYYTSLFKVPSEYSSGSLTIT
jgi:hypothetical protein